eukprot:360262-Chlamydomonas_euryale.AAC.15
MPGRPGQWRGWEGVGVPRPTLQSHLSRLHLKQQKIDTKMSVGTKMSVIIPQGLHACFGPLCLHDVK